MEAINNETAQPVVFDWRDVCSIENEDNHTRIFFFARSGGVTIEVPFSEAKKEFEESRLRDKFTGQLPTKTTQTKHNVVEVGEHKFQVDIHTSEWDNEVRSSIHFTANFPVKNDRIETFVEYVAGVESYNGSWGSKYSCGISVGKLFDIKKVRDDVEQKIKEFLQA